MLELIKNFLSSKTTINGWIIESGVKINRVFIIPLFQFQNVFYSIIPVKKNSFWWKIYLSHYSAPQWHYPIIPTQKKLPLFLLHYSSPSPKIETAMLSLSESQSTVNFSHPGLFYRLVIQTKTVLVNPH